MISELEPEDYLLPGIGTLEATPEILRGLLASVTEEQTLWKPTPERWSIAEVLEHLSHVEGHGFRMRAERIVNEESPLLEVYDQEALSAAGQYSGRDVEDSFDHFEEQREDNVAWLTSLPARVVSRTAQHQELGTITLGHLLNEWAFHDLGHIRQIAEIVRALVYYPNIGPFVKYYTVNP
jgi:DinB superfamily